MAAYDHLLAVGHGPITDEMDIDPAEIEDRATIHESINYGAASDPIYFDVAVERFHGGDYLVTISRGKTPITAIYDDIEKVEAWFAKVEDMTQRQLTVYLDTCNLDYERTIQFGGGNFMRGYNRKNGHGAKSEEQLADRIKRAQNRWLTAMANKKLAGVAIIDLADGSKFGISQ